MLSPGMMKQVIKLTQVINPAVPTNTAAAKIMANTYTWMDNNMQITRTLYTG